MLKRDTAPFPARRFRSAGAAVLGLLTIGSLSACAEEEPPVGTTNWQVQSIYQDPDVPAQLPEEQQGRAFLRVGMDALSGESGCMSLAADLDWDEAEKQLQVGQVHAEERSRHDGCAPGDQRNAERLADVLSEQTLEYSRPAGETLRLQQVHEGTQDWETPKSLTLIAVYPE